MNSDYPPVNSAVNLYPLPPLTTGGKSVMSSVPSQSTVGKSVVSTNTTASVSTNNQVSNQESKTELFIENPVLTYIRSQLFRLSQAEVISLTSANFGFDELKVAREALFRKSGTKTYKYVGPNDPATQVEKSNHCCAGIISKLQDLQKKGISVNCVCSAKDLLRVSTILCQSGVSGVDSPNKVDKEILDEHARRISSVEFEIRYLKSLPHNINPAAVPTPRYIPADNNRLDYLKALGNPTALSSPSKRRKTAPRPSSPLVRSTSRGAASPAVLSSPAWQTVKPRKRNKPELEHVPKGLPPRENSNSLQVFLFRYHEDETPSSVLKYFQDVGVSSAYHARYCCHEDSRSKNFVIRFRKKEEFPNIIKGLPDYTGCRWYTPDPPSGQEGRPQGWFNFGGRIKGPDIEAILGDDQSMDTSSMDLFSSQNNEPTAVVSTQNVNNSQTAITRVTSCNQGPISTSTMQTPNSAYPSSTSIDPGLSSMVSSQGNIIESTPVTTLNNPVPTSDSLAAGQNVMNGISVLKSPQHRKTTPGMMADPVQSSPLEASGNNVSTYSSALDSPHLQTTKISYQKFVHDSDLIT